MLTFRSVFSLSFSLIKWLFSSSSLSAIRVVSSAYLRLLIFFLAILIPACDSSSPALHMMYSACKLNKQGDNIQPYCTPSPILNQSVSCSAVYGVTKNRTQLSQLTTTTNVLFTFVISPCEQWHCAHSTGKAGRLWRVHNRPLGIPLCL